MGSAPIESSDSPLPLHATRVRTAFDTAFSLQIQRTGEPAAGTSRDAWGLRNAVIADITSS